MVHPSSNKIPNDISGAVFIFEKLRICLACLLSPGSWSVAMCDDSIVIPSVSLDLVPFEMMTRAIVEVACFSSCIFAPKYTITSVFFYDDLVGS